MPSWCAASNAWAISTSLGVGWGGEVVVEAVGVEGGVAQVAPQHREHAQLVRRLERVGDLDELARGLLAAEVDRGANSDRAELPGALHARRSEEHTSELQSLRHLVC